MGRLDYSCHTPRCPRRMFTQVPNYSPCPMPACQEEDTLPPPHPSVPGCCCVVCVIPVLTPFAFYTIIVLCIPLLGGDSILGRWAGGCLCLPALPPPAVPRPSPYLFPSLTFPCLFPCYGRRWRRRHCPGPTSHCPSPGGGGLPACLRGPHPPCYLPHLPTTKRLCAPYLYPTPIDTRNAFPTPFPLLCAVSPYTHCALPSHSAFVLLLSLLLILGVGGSQVCRAIPPRHPTLPLPT